MSTKLKVSIIVLLAVAAAVVVLVSVGEDGSVEDAKVEEITAPKNRHADRPTIERKGRKLERPGAVRPLSEIQMQKEGAPLTVREGRRAMKSMAPKERIKMLEAEAAKDPKNPRTQRSLGKAYMKMQQYENAIKTFKKAIEMEPADARTHYFCAVSYERLGNENEALSSYEKAMNAGSGPFKKRAKRRYKELSGEGEAGGG